MGVIIKILVNIFRYIFMEKIIIITCIGKLNGVITHIGGMDNDKTFFLPKNKFLIRLRAYERWGYKIKVRTKHKTKVQVISNRYLRTIGDKNPLNDLGDLPTCK